MENDKKEILSKAMQMSGELLINLMIELEVPNYIESTILDVKDNQKYKLRIEKISKKSIFKKIYDYFKC